MSLKDVQNIKNLESRFVFDSIEKLCETIQALATQDIYQSIALISLENCLYDLYEHREIAGIKIFIEWPKKIYDIPQDVELKAWALIDSERVSVGKEPKFESFCNSININLNLFNHEIYEIRRLVKLVEPGVIINFLNNLETKIANLELTQNPTQENSKPEFEIAALMLISHKIKHAYNIKNNISTQAASEIKAKAHGFYKNIININKIVLYYAQQNNLELFNEFINLSVIEIDAQDENGDTALHWAIRHNNNLMIAKLLNKGAYAYIINKHGSSALDLAISCNNPEAVLAIKSLCQIRS